MEKSEEIIVRKIKEDLLKPVKYNTNIDSESTPLVSVIIPFRGRIESLKKVVNRIEGQSEKNVEVVLIDDASEHDVEELLKWIKSRQNLKYQYIRYERSDYNSVLEIRRAGQLRNEGAENSKGQNLVFLDSDIIIDSDYIERAIKHLDSNDKSVYMCLRNDDVRKRYFLIFDDFEDMKNKWKLLHSHNFAIRKSLFLEASGFSREFIFWGGEDEEFGYKLFQKEANFFVDREYIVKHIEHKTENLPLTSKILANRNYKSFFQKYMDNDIKSSYDFNRKELYLFLNDECNNNCDSCGLVCKKGKQNDLSDIKREVDFAVLNNVRVILAGGEIALRTDYKELLDYLEQHREFVELATNGRIYSNKKLVETLFESLSRVKMFIFGFDNESYDRMAKVQNGFNQMMKGRRNLLDCGFEVQDHIIVDKDSVNSIGRMNEFGLRIKLTYWYNGDVSGYSKIYQSGTDFVLTNSIFKCFNMNNEIERSRLCLNCELLEKCRGRIKFAQSVLQK